MRSQPAARRASIWASSPSAPGRHGRRHLGPEPRQFGCELIKLAQEDFGLAVHGLSLARQRPLAQRRTLVIRIKQTAMSVGMRPSDRSKAGYAGLNTLGVDIRPRRTALDGALKGGTA
jgi:hypothetical protein